MRLGLLAKSGSRREEVRGRMYRVRVTRSGDEVATAASDRCPTPNAGPMHGLDLAITYHGSGHDLHLHVICYFARFSFTFSSPTAKISDLIRFPTVIFPQFRNPFAIYCDRGQHFDSEKTKFSLKNRAFRSASVPLDSSKAQEWLNRILKSVMRKNALA